MLTFSWPFAAAAEVGYVGVVGRLLMFCVAFAIAADIIPGSFWTGAVCEMTTLATVEILRCMVLVGVVVVEL